MRLMLHRKIIELQLKAAAKGEKVNLHTHLIWFCVAMIRAIGGIGLEYYELYVVYNGNGDDNKGNILWIKKCQFNNTHINETLSIFFFFFFFIVFNKSLYAIQKKNKLNRKIRIWLATNHASDGNITHNNAFKLIANTIHTHPQMNVIQ